MAGGFMSYSKNNRCPICGRIDWCTYKAADNGSYMYVCIREKRYEKGNVFMGLDGREYESKGMTSNGNYYFYLHADCERWRQEHGYKKGGGSYRDNNTVIPPRIPKKVQHMEDVEALDNEKLHNIYSFVLGQLKLEDADREYLHSEGFTDEIIDEYMIRTLPEPDDFRFKNRNYRSSNYLRKDIAKMTQSIYGDLTGVPGFYEEKDKNGYGTGVWQICGLGGILFPLIDPFGYTYRLRVRVHRPNVGKGKYRNFSSYQSETIYIKEYLDIVRNKYLNGTSAGNNCGLYASIVDEYQVVFVAKGEKKGIILNEYFNCPVVILPGGDSCGKILEPIHTAEAEGKRFIDILKERGTKILILTFDVDKSDNDDVFKNEQQTLAVLKEEGFIIASAEWDESNGKGIDKLLRNGFNPRFKCK